jgi:hypothetical protein
MMSNDQRHATLRCFLHGLGVCGGGWSREHFLSLSLLDLIAPDRSSLEVLGLSWLERDTFKSIGKSSLVARVLCKRHNELLSTLDDSALAFVRAISLADSNLRSETSSDSLHAVSGRALERWCLKLLLGMLASGQLSARSSARLKPVESCRSLLVEPDKHWPPGWGLYFPVPADPVFHSASFECRPLSNPSTGEVLSLEVAFNGIRATLVMGAPDNPDLFGTLRPARVIMENDRSKRIISLDWAPERSGADYSLLLSSTYSGQPLGQP